MQWWSGDRQMIDRGSQWEQLEMEQKIVIPFTEDLG